MIQRIQSLFLALSAISFFSLFKLPFANSSQAFGQIYQDLKLDVQDHTGLMALTVIGGITCLAALLSFKNRNLQSSLGMVGIALSIALAGFAFWIYNSNPSEAGASPTLSSGFGMPIVALIMCILALVFIKKDEKLVKSMDRLR